MNDGNNRNDSLTYTIRMFKSMVAVVNVTSFLSLTRSKLKSFVNKSVYLTGKNIKETNIPFPCPFLAKSHPCLFIVLFIGIINKQSYG